MPTVWIPAIPSRWDSFTKTRVPTVDVSLAESFGSLKQIVGIDENVDGNLQGHALKVAETIKMEYQAGDYLMAVGDLVLCVVAAANVTEKFGSVRLLRWRKKPRGYVVIPVHI